VHEQPSGGRAMKTAKLSALILAVSVIVVAAAAHAIP
jgi:hypothetical protein